MSEVILSRSIKHLEGRAGEIAQPLRALAAPPEDQFPESTWLHTTACNSSPRGPDALSPLASAGIRHTCGT